MPPDLIEKEEELSGTECRIFNVDHGSVFQFHRLHAFRTFAEVAVVLIHNTVSGKLRIALDPDIHFIDKGFHHFLIGKAKLNGTFEFAGLHPFAILHRIKFRIGLEIFFLPDEPADDIVTAAIFQNGTEFKFVRVGAFKGVPVGSVAGLPGETVIAAFVSVSGGHLPAAEHKFGNIDVVSFGQSQIFVRSENGSEFRIRTRPDDIAVFVQHPENTVENTFGTAGIDVDFVAFLTHGITVVALEFFRIFRKIGRSRIQNDLCLI